MALTTRLGLVEGLQGGGISMFLGIPYGVPAGGERRFLAPEAAGPWRGTLRATALPNRAMQPRTEGTLGQVVAGQLDEDCLYLNVYTPAADAACRPVMVWIHGGGFAAGSANEYDGRVLAAQGDLVAVTINYRLGPFGFLDLSPLDATLAASASNGYRDMILALAWVRDNIADYGGDPGNVTIFGESAGGAAVLDLLGAPSAAGLFHKAIAHSPGGPRLTVADRTPAMAEILGIAHERLLSTLRAMPAAELQRAGLPIGATLDGTVLARDPVTAIRSRGRAGVPLIVGTNRDEGTLFTPADGDDDNSERHGRAMQRLASSIVDGGDPTRYLAGLRRAYPRDSNKALYERIFTDLFRRPGISAALAATEAGPGGWLYRFDLPTTRLYNGKLTGATHACEMAFTFNAFADPECHVFAFHDRDDPVVKRLGDQWSRTLTAFARTGTPNGAGLPQWPRYDASARDCMVLSAQPQVEQDPDRVHRELWGSADRQ